MKLFDKRNIVLIMSIFLLLLMVSSVSAADVSEDAVIGNDAAIDTITSTDIDSGSIDDVISAEVSDNPKANPSDSNESLSGDIVADASSNNDNSNQNSVDDSSQDVLKASSDDEVLTATEIHVGPGRTYTTINAALGALNNANTDYEIIIDSGTYSHTQTMNIGHTFRSLVVRAADGADVIITGHVGNSYHEIFTISHDNVAFKGITFVNGSGSGGAFGITANHFSVDNCSFIDCGAKTTALQSGVLGGAIHVGSTWGGNNYHDINITNCNFDHCLAQVGGCIRTETGTHDVLVKDCNFTNNNATKHGGVTCFYGYGITVENCMVVNNTASSDAGLHFHTANSTVRNCTFIGNVADGKGIEDDHQGYGNGFGGALGLVYNTEQPGVTIEDCHFINNSAAADGGAINIQGDGGGAKIINCTFEGNNATDGGAVKIKGSNTTIEGSTFVNNTATNTSGGAIEITGPNTHLTNVTVANNTANTNGGGIFINGTNTVIADSEIDGNDAGVNGGGVYILGSNTNITNTTFDSNVAHPAEDNMDEGLGGSIYVAGNNGHISDCNFTNNTGRNGSAIYVNPTNPNNRNYIDNCDFEENQAWSYWLPLIYNDTHVEVNITGGNNILNAIYNNGPNTSIFIDGANPVLGWEASGNGTKVYQDVREAYQDIEVVIYDTQGHVVYNQTHQTGLGGNVTFELTEHDDSDAWFFVVATHLEDTYYKEIVNGTACDLKPNVTVSNVTMYEGDETGHPVIVILADESAHAITVRGNITVYLVDENTVIANGSTRTGFFTFNESTYFKTMPVGDYPIIANFTYVDRVYDHGRWVNVTRTITGQGTLHVLPYNWTLTKEIFAVNGQPYVEGMEIHVNDNITFNITVTNNVDADITSVKITDLDTENLTYLSYEGSGWQKVDGANVWTLDNLPANGNSSLMVTFNILNYGNSINVANASIFSDKYNKSANATFKVTHVELSIVKTADPSEVYVGDNVTFTIVVTNNGDGVAHNANITDVLDPAFEYVSGADSYDEATRTATWNVGEIAANGGTATVTVVVTVLTNGTFNNTAVVVCDENETETNNSTNITVRNVVLDITKSANPTEVYVGDNVTFTIVVTNNGDGVAHNANITDVLDPAFEYVSGADSYDEATRTATWNVGEIAANGGTATVTVVVTVLTNGTFNNTAVVVCDENETETNNSTNVTVKPLVCLEITKDVNETVVVIGDEVEFTITVTNNGKSNATKVNVTDELPGGFTTTSPVEVIIDLIEPGNSATVKITAVAVKAGDWINNASATCTENATVVNASAPVVTVNRLTITISVENYTTTPGTTVPVEITVVDQRGNNVTINLTVVVTGPNATDSLPEHEGKLVFAFTTDLGADGKQVEITNGHGTYDYPVPDSAKDGESFVVTASSKQNDQYEAAEGTGYIDVIQYETTTTISDASGKPGETVTLDVEVTTEDGTPFNGDVVITCPDGKKVTVTVKDGKGQFDWTIPEDAKAGDEYQFTATFEGNSTYLASSGNGTVTVEEPEPKPEPPVPVPEPEPEEPVVTPAKMLNTGNPLVALLAAFVLIGLGLKRREEE